MFWVANQLCNFCSQQVGVRTPHEKPVEFSGSREISPGPMSPPIDVPTPRGVGGKDEIMPEIKTEESVPEPQPVPAILPPRDRRPRRPTTPRTPPTSPPKRRSQSATAAAAVLQKARAKLKSGRKPMVTEIIENGEPETSATPLIISTTTPLRISESEPAKKKKIPSVLKSSRKSEKIQVRLGGHSV